MDPLWLSLVAIVCVIVGVLVAKLHPFLALTFGALLVALCTPPEQLFDVALKGSAHRVVAMEVNQVNVAAGELSAGRNLVYRKPTGDRFTKEVGEVYLYKSRGDGELPTVGGNSFQLEPGDLLIHESLKSGPKKAAKLSAGQRLATGFGDTCRKIGILIAMASVIGTCLLQSGAAQRIVDSTRSLVGEQRTPLAFTVSGFIVGIPVFFDTVFYLLMPLARAMRLKTGGNYLLYVMSIVIGATMAHSLVPPTPGPLYVASEIPGVSVGNMIIGGLIIGLITVASGFLYSLWANRVWEIPLRETDAEGGANDDSGNEAATNDGEGPSVFVSLLPILLPVAFLAGKTFTDSLGTAAPAILLSAKPVIDFFGDKNIALIVAAVVALAMLAWQRSESGKPWFDGLQKAVSSGGVIILITAAGGAFGHVLRQCGVAEAIQARFPSTQDGLVLLVLAFVVTAVVRFAQGSATVSMITSVGIVAPLAADLTLGFHPVYLALAIGCGSKPLPWMNDSGFWIVGRMSGMTESETLKTFSVTLTIMGFVGFLVTLAGAKWLPLVGS